MIVGKMACHFYLLYSVCIYIDIQIIKIKKFLKKSVYMLRYMVRIPQLHNHDNN